MTLHTPAHRTFRMSFRQAFEAEHARRDAERRTREDAQRAQQEEDLARAEQLHDRLAEELIFLTEKGLVLDRQRYTILLDHPDYRLRAYFEAGSISITSADKRTASPGAVAPRKQQTVATVDEALDVLAQFLADETD
jgi:hypothetical protein